MDPETARASLFPKPTRPPRSLTVHSPAAWAGVTGVAVSTPTISRSGASRAMPRRTTVVFIPRPPRRSPGTISGQSQYASPDDPAANLVDPQRRPRLFRKNSDRESSHNYPKATVLESSIYLAIIGGSEAASTGRNSSSTSSMRRTEAAAVEDRHARFATLGSGPQD